MALQNKKGSWGGRSGGMDGLSMGCETWGDYNWGAIGGA